MLNAGLIGEEDASEVSTTTTGGKVLEVSLRELVEAWIEKFYLSARHLIPGCRDGYRQATENGSPKQKEDSSMEDPFGGSS